MIEREGVKLYTAREVEKVMCVGYPRILEALDNRTLIPTDMEPWRGRAGFRYLFSEEEVSRYAEKVGMPVRWERLDMKKPKAYDEEHEHKVLDARREVREMIDPAEEKKIRITAENVREVFGQIQGEKPQERKLEMYVVQLGKGYITVSQGLTTQFEAGCMMLKDCAEEMQNIYGGTVMQLYAREV